MSGDEPFVFTPEQLRVVLDVMHTAVIITDTTGAFRVFNKSAERIMGLGPKEVTPSEWADTYGVYHTDRTTPYAVDEYPVTRALKGVVVEYEEMFIRNQNVPQGLPIHVSAVPFRNGTGEIIGAVATINDISPIKQIEGRLDDVGRQLLQAQKMEAVGRLAGGVAHDFNNQLSVILSCAHMALDATPDDGAAREDISEIISAGERAATLTRQLLALSRRQVASPRVLVADEIVKGIEKMLRRMIGEDVELKFKLNSDEACVVIDPSHLEQLLMNLAVNARDAMPDGGMLLIESSSAMLDEDYANGHIEITPGPYYCLTVTDTGYGMDADTRSRIFEPFFTTKAPGKGTGLGMSIVHGVVKQANGHVFVYSEPGQGTSIKMYFPRVDREATRNIELQQQVEVDGNGRTVLLVEDEDKVRAAARRVLQKHGFEVLEAGNAEEARSIAISTQKFVDVLVTDVVMPGLSGPELAVQLVRMLPGMRVVLMSGYPADALLHRKTDLAKAKLVGKPFTPTALLSAVGSVLAPRRDTGEVDKTFGRVLLVEDEEQLRRLMKRTLESKNFHVHEAGTAAAALSAFDNETFDVVVSDITLPDGDGLEILKQIRQHDMDVPVILMTGAPDVEKATEAVRYGAYRFLAKPVPTDELIEIVNYAVRIGRLARIKRDALNIVGKDSSRPRDLAGLEMCFENALANLWVEFQPILRSSDRYAHAFEVLMRNGEPSLRSPLVLLKAAANLGRLPELGRMIRLRAAESLQDAPDDALLFVNLHAQDLDDKELYDPDSPLSKIAARIVLEITEREALDPGEVLENNIRKLRALGYRIAVDDLGAGYSGLASFAQLSPEIVKLDMSLVRDIDSNMAKQKTVGAMVELCQGLNIQVVAEGVETAAERDVLVKLGCDFLQGYYFARPSRGFVNKPG